MDSENWEKVGEKDGHGELYGEEAAINIKILAKDKKVKLLRAR